MQTLFAITSEYEYLLQLMEDPDTDSEVLADTLEAIQGEMEVKLDSYGIVLKELESEKAKWEAEQKRAESYVTSISSNITRMKTAIMDAIRATGDSKFKTDHFRFSIAKNGGLQPLKITGTVSDSFMILKPEPDMKAIRTALEEGFELNFAHLEERGSHLNIK